MRHFFHLWSGDRLVTSSCDERDNIRLDHHITDIQLIILFIDGQTSKMLEKHMAQNLLYARCPGGIPAYLNIASSNKMSV